ncbi:MAG: DUF4177 domain-containing protein [Chloroflexota bacterium]
MQKFEYLVVYITDSNVTDDAEMDRHLDADRFTEQLNKFGDAGWELVSFEWESSNSGAKAAFKRPKAEE